MGKTDLIDTINWIDTDKYGVFALEYSFIRISDDAGETVLIKHHIRIITGLSKLLWNLWLS